ncbi:cation diffusion facilitator family transporter [Dactylosporangium darangshiense]|uniref:Cation diffusion facilitator family transporter n=1 Tax=Dactylosporangium darangshiense TaxID=579108 RepID=A0ABP8DF11_9ACTN
MAGDARDDSMRTVVIALLVNLVVAVIKAVAGVLTASAGLLAEAAHSVGDCTTEVFLMTALRRSRRPADPRHPFGHGKERYFWSLLAAMAIFGLGAGFSVYQGVSTIVRGEADTAAPYVGYIVILLAAASESVSLTQAYGRARRESRAASTTLTAYLREPEDPTVKSVILEDAAALIGLALAGAGLLARQLTGDELWDGVAALAIAALLIVVAFELARTNGVLLIGRQANPRLVGQIAGCLAEQPEVASVVDVRTMMMGTGRVLVCARVDFADAVSSSGAEHACVRFHALLADRFAAVGEVFIEPVPRDDAALRAEAARTRAR